MERGELLHLHAALRAAVGVLRAELILLRLGQVLDRVAVQLAQLLGVLAGEVLFLGHRALQVGTGLLGQILQVAAGDLGVGPAGVLRQVRLVGADGLVALRPAPL